MKARITFEYGTIVSTEVAQQLAARLNAKITDLVLDKNGSLELQSWREFEGDLEDIAAFGIPFVVKGEAQFNFVTYMFDEVKKLSREVTGLSAKFDRAVTKDITGTIVHIPNQELFSIKECMVLNDCCTDALNDHIKNGWRILAICPQPNQRRPDYIMGLLPEEKNENYQVRR